jgi:hypothetical protein
MRRLSAGRSLYASLKGCPWRRWEPKPADLIEAEEEELTEDELIGRFECYWAVYRGNEVVAVGARGLRDSVADWGDPDWGYKPLPLTMLHMTEFDLPVEVERGQGDDAEREERGVEFMTLEMAVVLRVLHRPSRRFSRALKAVMSLYEDGSFHVWRKGTDKYQASFGEPEFDAPFPYLITFPFIEEDYWARLYLHAHLIVKISWVDHNRRRVKNMVLSAPFWLSDEAVEGALSHALVEGEKLGRLFEAEIW